jgi:Calcineurin-like phosphoesterase
MNPLHFTRVRDQSLSLWQSAVAEYVRNELTNDNKSCGTRDILDHPMSKAAAEHTLAAFEKKGYVPKKPKSNKGHRALVYQSHLAYQIAQAKLNNDLVQTEALITQYRKFSDKDYTLVPPTGFATCELTYLAYQKSTGGKMTYNDWTIQGNGNINYGMIDWKLPNNAKVAILGDWGTGMPDAVALLKDIIVNHKPDAIIHLGDIYYAGTPTEVHQYFGDVFTQVFNEVLGAGNRIPVFSIPGNHDYYAFGAEYYKVVTGLNNYPGMESAIQNASYFSLRTEDGGWQFLGMDTGFFDSNPVHQFDPLYAGPWLHDSEITWLRDKMTNFNGASILLSHHQVFSANSAINGKNSVLNGLKYYNPYLYRVFWDFMSKSVAGWIWGHEHNYVMYQEGLFGLNKGRLLGNSAYEELTSADPYTVNYPQIPYLTPEPQYDQYKLGTNADSNGVTYYNHGFAIIDLGGRQTPTSPVYVQYYQYPAWGDIIPANPQSSLIFHEPFTLPPHFFAQGTPVLSGTTTYLANQDGLFLGNVDSGALHYYGTMVPRDANGYSASQFVNIFKYVNNVAVINVPINSGDIVTIDATQSVVHGRHLTAGSLPWLYFDTSVNNNSLWQIIKPGASQGTPLMFGDAIYFMNLAYPNQVLVPSYSVNYATIYLTTEVPPASTNTNTLWTLMEME